MKMIGINSKCGGSNYLTNADLYACHVLSHIVRSRLDEVYGSGLNTC